jgi:hypothetical protein
MAENSPIQAKGVGKDSKRHDLDGTPGLSDGSSLEQGDVQELERGQQVVANTQGQQTVTQAPPPRAALPAEPMAVPDAVTFAGQKAGGNLAGAGQQALSEKQSFSNWLPLLRRLATSPTSSGLLQRAFLARIQAEQRRPQGGKAALIRQRDLDERLAEFNNGR